MLANEAEIRAIFDGMDGSDEGIACASKALAQAVRATTHPVSAESRLIGLQIDAFCADTCRQIAAGELSETVATADVLQVIQIGQSENKYFSEFISQ